MKYLKQTFYIFAFILLGMIITTLMHAGIELVALNIIFENPTAFGGTFWWQEWSTLHAVGGTILLALGFIGGLYFGIKYWDVIYIQDKRNKTVRSM